MRNLAFLLTASLLIIDLAPTRAADLPMNRPALIGSAPDALVNKIDTQDLIKKGQKAGAIMFCCIVAESGDVVWSVTYRGTPDSKPLEQEVLKRLAEAKFIPAIHDRKPVRVFFYGTVVFSIVKDKPRLRIFANQEKAELEKENDFIAPQPYVGGDSKFDGFHTPEKLTPVSVTGTAEVSVTVDVSGNLKGIELVSEYPPFLRFGEAALSDFGQAKFIPAYRNGQPVESEVTLAAYCQPLE